MVKNPSANAGDTRDVGLISGLERSPGVGSSNPIPVFLPGESHRQRSLVDYSLWGRKELDMRERACTMGLQQRDVELWVEKKTKLALERTGMVPSPDSIFVRSCPRAFRFGCLSAGSKTETQGPLERVCRSTTYLTHQKACLTTLCQFKIWFTRTCACAHSTPKTCAYDASIEN